MNQAIQFPEHEYWDAKRDAVCFLALVNGFQVQCAILSGILTMRYGDHQTPLTLFVEYRWDLEEEAEIAIRNEQFDNQGWVWLS